MLNIVCINAGDYLGRGAEYVTILHDSVRRNLAEGTEGRFICFTDDEPANYGPGIEVRPLPEPGLTGWWNKLALFKPGVFEDGDRVLYFDLDTVITGRLDEIVAYDGPFAILRDAYRSDGLQSSVMAWEVNESIASIWLVWEQQRRPEVPGGDQAWIERCVAFADILQDKFPDLFVSYKATGGKPPQKASVVFFHGHPRPHEVTTGWVPEVWEVGGLTRAELDTVCNTATQEIHRNVRFATSRLHPWFDLKPANDDHAVIVGGGPSVKSKLDEIRWRQSLGQSVWALNGSADFLTANGIVPDYHVIVDARQDNARFVEEAHPETHYLIASQCSPKVFDALKGHTVTIWHSAAPDIEAILGAERARPVHLIGGGSTVGLQAIVLAHSWGVRKFHLYGFDSSIAESHHAYPQDQNNADIVVDVIAGEEKFRAAPWMVQQAREFMALASELAQDDAVVITVSGDGLLPHLARLGTTQQVRAAGIRAREILSRLIHYDNPVGAEIGVFTGEMSAHLLTRSDLTLYMVDSWKGDGIDYTGDSGDFHAGLTQGAQDGYREHAEAATAFAGDRARILRDTSTNAAHDVPDGSLDFVFIDADHSYEGCRADIHAWAPKLKPGGLLSGHDYDNPAFPKFGVKRAVDEFARASGVTIELGDNFTWFIRMPIAAEKAA